MLTVKDKENTVWNKEDINFLLRLLKINTISPMETGVSSNLLEAQNLYASYAKKIGFKTLYFATPPYDYVLNKNTPMTILDKLKSMGESFLDNQPNLVLKLGRDRALRNTISFNFHMDTVDSLIPVSFDKGIIKGRGVADAKGLGVALLVGVRQAILNNPDLLDKISIIIHSVGGEEGGAIGWYGSKYIASLGYIGRLNIVCEPTNMFYFNHSTTSMTARIDVQGTGSTDDAPYQGHNATLILSYLASQFASKSFPKIHKTGSKMCISGLCTGTMHNKIYGEGALLINFAYSCQEAATQIEKIINDDFVSHLNEFSSYYNNSKIIEKTAKDIRKICTLTWTKKGLPVLKNHDSILEKVLSDAGFKPAPENEPSFTCDAMWFQAPKSYAVIIGPGSLDGNGAHTDSEFMTLTDLERFSKSISSLLRKFSEQ